MQAGRRVVGSYGPREKAPCPLRDWTRAQHDRLHTSIQSLQSAKKRRTHQGKGVNALAPNWPSTLRWLFVAQDRDVCLNIDLVGKGKVVNLRFRGNANRVPSKNKASGCTPINSDNMRWGGGFTKYQLGEVLVTKKDTYSRSLLQLLGVQNDGTHSENKQVQNTARPNGTFKETKAHLTNKKHLRQMQGAEKPSNQLERVTIT